MKLIKYLQYQGIGSRKQCQWLIAGGYVFINGTCIDDADADIDSASVYTLDIDGKAVTVIPEPYFYILLNKPADYETSHKPKHYRGIFSLFPDNMRNIDMQAVGRLDADTTGVLLITNDGKLNHNLTSPSRKIPKLYEVTLKHPADGMLCETLKTGVLLHDDNETVCAADADLESPTTLLLTITEGKYHQVKRMIAAAGNRVQHLHRRQFAHLETENLKPGEWKFIECPKF